MATLGNLIVNITASTKGLEQGLSRSKGLIKGAGSALGGLGGIAATAATGGLALAAGGVAAVGATAVATGVSVLKMADDFQDASDALVAGTGAEGEALSELEGVVKSLSKGTGGINREFGELGAVVAEAQTRTGAWGEDLEDFSKGILDMSRLTGDDAVESVELVTRVMGDWGVEMDDSAALMDKLFGASQAFGIGVNDVSRLVVQFGAPMRQMGFTIDESIALFGKWEKEGVNAELAIGSLRNASGYFAREQIPLQEGLQNTMDAIKGAETESEGLALAMEVFGARAGPDMAAAIREGRFELDEAVLAIADTEGALGDATQGTLHFSERWGMLKQKVLVALMPIGEKVLDLAERIMPKLEPVVGAVADFIETKLLPAAGNLGGWIKETGIPTIQEWVTTFRERLAPVIELVSGFVSDTLLPAAGRFTGWIQDTLLPLIAGWQDAYREGLQPALERIWERLQEFYEQIQPKLAEAWEALQRLWEKIVDVYEAQLRPALERLVESLGLNTVGTNDLFEGFGKLVGFLLEAELEGIILLITGAIDGFILVVDGITFVVEPAIWILSRMYDSFTAIVDVVKWVIDRIVEFKDLLGDLDNRLPDWLTPGSPTPFELGLRGIADAMNDVNDVSIGVDMRPAVVHGGETITPAGGSGGTGNIQIIFQGNGGPTSQQEADEAGYMIVGALRARGVAI